MHKHFNRIKSVFKTFIEEALHKYSKNKIYLFQKCQIQGMKINFEESHNYQFQNYTASHINLTFPRKLNNSTNTHFRCYSQQAFCSLLARWEEGSITTWPKLKSPKRNTGFSSNLCTFVVYIILNSIFKVFPFQ